MLPPHQLYDSTRRRGMSLLEAATAKEAGDSGGEGAVALLARAAAVLRRAARMRPTDAEALSMCARGRRWT